MNNSARLTMHGIVKNFGPTAALRGVDLELRSGEVHALIGENGAGKSTLMKILSGAEQPDAGTMTLDGQPFTPTDPQEARRAGVAMIYQELTLAEDLDVEANILLGLESTRWGFLRKEVDHQRVRDALAVLQHDEIRLDMPVSALTPGGKQLVEISRALLVDVKLLVLDEPTSALTHTDVDRLFQLITRLRERGVTVVYISHFLEECQHIADRYTVLRDGQSVATAEMRTATRNKLIQQMIGREIEEQYPRIPHSIGEPVLTTTDLLGVNLTLHHGEILGIAGIIGAGRTELLRAIFALDPVQRGEVSVLTSRLHREVPATPTNRIRQGVGMLSEDRKLEGLALEQSIADNLTYSWLRPYSFLGFLNLTKRMQAVRQYLDQLGVRFRAEDQPVGELSGGNQQKVALGRLLHQDADILLLDEPTRGVDVGSKTEIYRLMNDLVAQGKSIIMVSSYLPELLGVCDRLAVMFRGRLSEIKPIDEWSPEEVMAYATGETQSSHHAPS